MPESAEDKNARDKRRARRAAQRKVKDVAPGSPVTSSAPSAPDTGISPNVKKTAEQNNPEQEDVQDPDLESESDEDEPTLTQNKELLQEYRSELDKLKKSSGKKSKKTKAKIRQVELAIQSLSTEIIRLETQPPSAWVALDVPLPKYRFKTKTKSSTKTMSPVNFASVPLTVQQLSHSDFLRVYNEFEKSSNIFNDHPLKIDILGEVKEQLPLSTELETIATDEIGIANQTCAGLCEPYLKYSTKNTRLLGLPHSYVSGHLGTLGEMDAQFRRGPNEEDLSVSVEFKKPIFGDQNPLHNIVSTWCNYPCHDLSCKSMRHSRTSPVRQLYNYMCANETHFGLLCTYQDWVLMIRDCKGNLFVTPSVYYDQRVPFTVPQFLTMVLRMAAEDSETVFAVLQREGIPIGSCDSADCTHKELPDDCEVAYQNSKHKNDSSYNGSPLDQVKLLIPTNNTAAKFWAHELIGSAKERVVLGEGLMGTCWKGAFHGAHAAIKIADVFKKPDFEKILQHEANIYNRLDVLQGQCVPSLLGHGPTREGFLYMLATEFVGKPVSVKSIVELEAQRTQALDALDKIHQLGVFHGDVRGPNILEDENQHIYLIDFGMSEPFNPVDDPANQDMQRLLREQKAMNDLFDALIEQYKFGKQGVDSTKKLKV